MRFYRTLITLNIDVNKRKDDDPYVTPLNMYNKYTDSMFMNKPSRRMFMPPCIYLNAEHSVLCMFSFSYTANSNYNNDKVVTMDAIDVISNTWDKMYSDAILNIKTTRIHYNEFAMFAFKMLQSDELSPDKSREIAFIKSLFTGYSRRESTQVYELIESNIVNTEITDKQKVVISDVLKMIKDVSTKNAGDTHINPFNFFMTSNDESDTVIPAYLFRVLKKYGFVESDDYVIIDGDSATHDNLTTEGFVSVFNEYNLVILVDPTLYPSRCERLWHRITHMDLTKCSICFIYRSFDNKINDTTISTFSKHTGMPIIPINNSLNRKQSLAVFNEFVAEYNNTHSKAITKIQRLNRSKESYTLSDIKSMFNSYALGNGFNKSIKKFNALRDESQKLFNLKNGSTGNDVDDSSINIDMSSLDMLIGLHDVKETINTILSVNTANKIYRKNGIVPMNKTHHMVFYGNPGTAKTTVARICAKMFFDAGIIKENKLTEVSRAELIAKYVGQTATKTNDIFKKGAGGVIFIDEAYSLKNGFNGDFGRESIDTIVRNLDNFKDYTVVIFAGYGEPMDEFLDQNPGLRSRISYILQFKDYSVDELLEIFKSKVSSYKFKTTSKVLTSVKEMIVDDAKKKGFGNGRYIRDLVDKMITKHSLRITKINNPSKKIIETLTLDDMVKSSSINKKDKEPVGFKA